MSDGFLKGLIKKTKYKGGRPYPETNEVYERF